MLDPTPLGQAWSHQEAVMSGSRSQWTEVAVDDDGEFLLEGLLDREYRLRAIDTETLVMGDFGPFHARRAPGRELSLTLATDQVFPLVSGRVVSLDGEPLGGISVHPQCDPQVMTRGAGRSVRHRSTAGTVTDDDGYFELTRVPRSLVYLRLDGEGILPLEFGRVSGYGDSAEKSGLPHEAVTELEIEVVQRAHLRVVLSNPGSADTFSVLDAAGETVPLHLIRANGHSTSGSMPIHSEGRSDVIALAETGAVVVLHAGVVEVGRAPVELVPGEVVDVTF